jgi:hypothetical protein
LIIRHATLLGVVLAFAALVFLGLLKGATKLQIRQYERSWATRSLIG